MLKILFLHFIDKYFLFVTEDEEPNHENELVGLTGKIKVIF